MEKPQTLKVDELVIPVAIRNDLLSMQALDGYYVKKIFLDEKHGCIWPADQECPNCGGRKGQGTLGAVTGDKLTRPTFMDVMETKDRYYGRHGAKVNVSGMVYIQRALVRYPCPVCQDDSFRSALRDQSGLADYPRVSVDIWERPGREQAEQAVNAFRGMCTADSRPRGWLTLIMANGRGKTAMAKALIKSVVECDRPARYYTAPALSRAIYQAMQTGSMEAVLDPLRRTPVVAIDELGMLRQRAASGEMTVPMESLYMVLDERYDAQKATILLFTPELWRRDLEGNPVPDQDSAGDLGPILSRCTKGDLVAVWPDQCPDLRPLAKALEADDYDFVWRGGE